jgi:preprotein translocase subunit SecG
MLIGVLLAINIVVCLALIGVVLLQRSEGGALGMGGGSSSFMTARGAGDLLTRITWILFSVFLVISLILTILTGRMDRGGSVADRLNIQGLDAKTLNAAPQPAAPTPGSLNSLPAAPAAQPGAIQAPTPQINAPSTVAPAPKAEAPKAEKKPAAAPKVAEKPAEAAAPPTVAAPAASQPKP